jgi:segregation and condensation protein A
MEQALERMRGLIGYAGEWADLMGYLPDGLGRTIRWRRRSATAATFAAVARTGQAGPDRDKTGLTPSRHHPYPRKNQ